MSILRKGFIMIKFTKYGRYGCFSNFYNTDVEFSGVHYTSAEAAFQAQKCADDSIKSEFSSLTPSEAKRKGRHVPLRHNWEEDKYTIMVGVLICKFGNPELRMILLSTGDEELVEDTTSWHDNIWGNCDCPRCRNIPGQNLLGKALMQVRDFYSKD